MILIRLMYRIRFTTKPSAAVSQSIESKVDCVEKN